MRHECQCVTYDVYGGLHSEQQRHVRASMQLRLHRRDGVMLTAGGRSGQRVLHRGPRGQFRLQQRIQLVYGWLLVKANALG